MKVEVVKLFNDVNFCIRTGPNTKFTTLEIWETSIIFSKSRVWGEGNYEYLKCNSKDFSYLFHKSNSTYLPEVKLFLSKRNTKVLKGGENEN